MAFLIKMAELQKSLSHTIKIINEAKVLFKKEGIGQQELNEKLEKVSHELKQSKEEVDKFLKDKQSIIE